MSRVANWWKLAAAVLFAVTQSGCQAVILLGYLIGGPPSIDPDFNVKTKESLKGREKTVLVLCYAPTELKWDNDAVDLELARQLGWRLNSNKINVIDPDRVHAWLDKNRNKDFYTPVEVGKEFKVDYVINLDLKKYSLYENHSSDLYRGQTDAIITVVKMDEDKKTGSPIYSKEIVSRFPTTSPVSAYTMAYDDFKRRYLFSLSDEIGTLFYPTFSGDKFGNTAISN